MNYFFKNARNVSDDATKRARECFGLSACADAVFLDSAGTRIFCVDGLKYRAPVCGFLLADPVLRAYIFAAEGDLKIDLRHGAEILNAVGKLLVPDDIRKRIEDVVTHVYASAGKLDREGNHIIDLKKYPVGAHFGINLLIGDRTKCPEALFTTPKSAVDAFGRGSFRAGGAQQVLATRYIIDMNENGEPYNRQFYLVEDGKQIFYSLDVQNNVKEAVCIHSANNTEIRYRTKCGLSITRTIFILPHDEGNPSATEVQIVRIQNRSKRDRRFRIVFTGAFGIIAPETTINDVVYANVVHQSELLCREGRPIAVSPHYKDENKQNFKQFATALGEDGSSFEAFCFDKDEFIGRGTLQNPEGLFALSCRLARKNSWFFALSKEVFVRAGGSAEVYSVAGLSESFSNQPTEIFAREISAVVEKLSPAYVAAGLKKIKRTAKKFSRFLSPETTDEAFNAYVAQNLPFQIYYQTFVSRSFAWTQKAYRETGFREIQDLFASMNYFIAEGRGKLAGNLISEWAKNVFEMGYAYHDFTRRGKEPGDCSDDQLWLVKAVYQYVMLSGDAAFLGKKFSVAGSKNKRRLIDTLRAILIYSGRISVGKHGLPLLDKADWNDTLRMDRCVLKGPAKEAAYRAQLAKSGQTYGVPFENELSESVMNACLLKIAADETAELAEMIGEDAIAEEAKTISQGVLESVRKNCWKRDFYARVLINDERKSVYPYLGAGRDNLSLNAEEDGTYFLNSFSWSVLSGIANEEEIGIMADVIERKLACSAGFRLCTLVDFSKLFDSTGTSLYYPGDRENGGVFKHAEMMAATAMLRAAKQVKNEALSERLTSMAAFAIEKTLPYKTMENPFVIKGNPRFCTQYNNSVTGENIGPILSGTASWLTLAIREHFGIEVGRDCVEFSPVLLDEKKPIAFTLRPDSTEIIVRVCSESGKRSISDRAKFILDGRKANVAVVPRDGKAHTLDIIL